MRVSELIRFGAPPPLAKVWAEHVQELTEIQEKAVEAGVFDGKTNLVVVGPTTSGKTLVGEMAAAASAYRTRRHGIFLVPFRALADEHYYNFRGRYGDLLPVVISTGDWTEFDDDIRAGNFGLAVMTYEKLIGLLVEHPQLLARCVALVVDEVQMLGDRGRGANLEMLLTQVLLHEQSPQLIALSASLRRINKLDNWLRAKLVMTNERPVPLAEGVLAPLSGRLVVAHGEEAEATALIVGSPDRDEALGQLVARFVDEGKQVLLFRSSVDKTRMTAERLKRYVPAPGLPSQAGQLLDGLEPSENVETLRLTLASLVGFHTADLTAGERRAVEQAFRAGEARVLVATTTLAMGVNLPTDVVVIGDSRRWYMERGDFRSEDLTVADYKNAAGRAGRLGQRTAGQAILVADRDVELRQLLDFYCRGQVDAVESALPAQPFDDVVFNVICNGLADDQEDLVEFVAATFAYPTFYETGGGVPAIADGVARAVDTCRRSGLVRDEGGKLAPTRSARIFARHSIPLSAATRLTALAKLLVDGPVANEDVVFEIASCDKLFDRPYIDWDRSRREPIDPRPTLPLRASSLNDNSSLRAALEAEHLDEAALRVVARTSCLLEWMGGSEEGGIARRYKGCPASRVRSMGKTAAWLLDALQQVASVRGAGEDQVDAVQAAALEARYGVPVPLAPLARLDALGVGRAALLRLYEGDAGRQLYEPDVLLDAELEEFDGLLNPAEVAGLRAAIVAERGETLRRRRTGHVTRAQQAALDAALIEDLYSAAGHALEQAVADALEAAGLSVSRVVRQPHGEEDLQISHPDGTIVASVTGSQEEAKRISWNKAREVLGTGAGMNPINYVCIGRPGFHSLAERKAEEIAREEGGRRLLLVPMDVLAEAVVRVREERLYSAELAEVLVRSRGLLAIGDLPKREEAAVEASS